MWYLRCFEWLIRTSIMASVLVCIIFAVKFMLKNRLGARWHYCIWFLLILRLIMPYFPESSASIYNVFTTISKSAHLKENISKYTVNLKALQPEKVDGASVNIQKVSAKTSEARHDSQEIFKLAFLLWLGGVLFFSGYIIAVNIRFMSKLGKNQSEPNEYILKIFEECKTKMGIIRKIEIIETPEVRGPAVLGLVHVKLVLPGRIWEKFSSDQLEHIFMHELSHLKRHDIAVKWLLSILRVLHWFNPILWLAFYRMAEDCELACDALVISKMDSKGYIEYGNTILSLAESFSRRGYITGMAGILDSKSQIKKRIVAITKFKHSSNKWSVLIAVLLVIMGAAVLTNARTTSGEKAKRIEPGVQRQVKKDDNQKELDKDAVKEGIRVYDIKEKRFDGKVMVVSDPGKISVGFKHNGKSFEGNLEEIAKDFNATAAVNAGSFYRDSFDEDNKDICPSGIIMHEGKIIYREKEDKDYIHDIVGFTEEGKLVAGKMSEEQMIKAGVKEAVGFFGPILIANGKPMIKNGDGGLGIAPRTAIGQRADGSVILLVINGRTLNSLGATLLDTQNILLECGAVNAVNLDGGSSTAMYYQGSIINRPSAKRNIPTAFVVMP